MPFFTKRSILAILAATASFTNSAFASDHVVVAPNCLLHHIKFTHQTLAQTSNLSLIKTSDSGISQLIVAKNNHTKPCGGFMDVTDAWQSKHLQKNAGGFLKSYEVKTSHQTLNAEPENKVRFPQQVEKTLLQVNPEAMWNNLNTLTNFKDRYSNSEYGVESAQWIKTTVEKMAAESGHSDDVVVWNSVLPRFKQPSVVAQFGHLNGNEPAIIISAHLDTVSSMWGGIKPGADDDGSGSVVVLEALRTLLNSGLHFQKPIYFIWYAAEEEGLIGSQQIAKNFKQLDRQVAAVLHFDCTGYAYQNDKTMWVMDDYTNKDLTNALTQYITTYVKKPVKHSRCGYACSDHASWTHAGYPAAIAAEAAYENSNPYMHTSDDTMDKLSLEHMTDYTKLAVATAIELAEPETK